SAVLRELQTRRGRIYGARLVVLAGSGNNGGDALYAAASLARRGASTTAVLTSQRCHPEALAAFIAAGGREVRLTEANTAELAVLCRDADVLIDGILGTGAAGGLRHPAAALVCAVAAAPPPLVVACDLPSGTSADTGELFEPVLRADVTVTFGGLKAGLLADPAAGAAGRVEAVDIRLGPHLPQPALRRLEPADVRELWPVPGRAAHKYSRGVLGIVAGSAQYPGAALLCTQAAAATGVGMVRYLGPADVCRLVNASTPEAVCSSSDSVADSRMQAWLVGPGTGTDPEQVERVRAALASGLPVIADANALDLLPDELAPQVVLTPHAGELVRILGRQDVEVTRGQVEASPSEFATLAAGLTGATVLLKGAATVIASPSGTLFSQDNATPWLATAGSGDTLAGILGALAATVDGPRLEDAGIAGPDRPAGIAALAAAVHGLAGRAASAGGPVAASDISRALPETIRRLLQA
ncbi:carbohydrate kinase, partial [Arthrobacter crystallopoietes BAB-32]